MMTRETKAGLVVSGSFLCLVGIVLVSKLREANHPESNSAGAGAVVEAPGETKPVEEGKGASAGDRGKGVIASAAQADGSRHGQNSVTPAAFKAEGIASTLPANGNTTTQPVPAASRQGSTQPKDNAGQAISDDPPMMEDGNKTNTTGVAPAPVPVIGIAQMPAKKYSILTWVPDMLKRKATSLNGMGLRYPSNNLTATSPTNAQANANQANNGKSLVNPPPLPPLNPQPETSRVSQPLILGVRPAPSPDSLTGDTRTGTGSPPSFGNDGTGNTNSSAPLPGQGAGIRTGLVGIAPVPVESNQSTQQGARLNGTINLPRSQMVQVPAGSTTQPAFNDDSPNRTRAPLGAPIPSVSVPIIAPSLPAAAPAAGAPQVESYDEDTYICKATDTFRTISLAAYHTEGYDQALLLFNRNHPLANDAIKQNSPVLQAGQAVYIPQVQILRKYYTSALTDGRDAAPQGAAVTPETTATIRPIVRPPTNSPAPAAPAERSYRVRGNGEMFRDIARRTLGNGDRWTEIYQLNRRYDPMYPVPAGSDLKLPGDARVDAE